MGAYNSSGIGGLEALEKLRARESFRQGNNETKNRMFFASLLASVIQDKAIFKALLDAYSLLKGVVDNEHVFGCSEATIRNMFDGCENLNVPLDAFVLFFKKLVPALLKILDKK